MPLGLGWPELIILFIFVGIPLLVVALVVSSARRKKNQPAIGPYGQAGIAPYGQGGIAPYGQGQFGQNQHDPSRPLGGPVGNDPSTYGQGQHVDSQHAYNQQGFTSSVGHFADVDQFILQGEPIRAIKAYREHTSAGLKEAKDAVDQRTRELQRF